MKLPRFGFPATLVLLFLSYPLYAEDTTKRFPPNAVPGGTYTVPADEVNLVLKELWLPDNFTINFAPTVTSVSWKIEKLAFGTNCTIDFSAPSARPQRASNAPNRSGQPRHGQRGSDGRNGSAGVRGRDGISFSLQLNQIVPQGGLWLRTDGGPGGDGGNGGRGQRGGGSSCGSETEPHTNGGRGGTGGRGGDGGAGGATSAAAVYFSGTGNPPIVAVDCSDKAAPSSRPAAANANDGTIVIWGAPGEGGQGGRGGRGGNGGTRNRTCFLDANVRTGPDGRDGANGRSGALGECSKALAEKFSIKQR